MGLARVMVVGRHTAHARDRRDHVLGLGWRQGLAYLALDLGGDDEERWVGFARGDVVNRRRVLLGCRVVGKQSRQRCRRLTASRAARFRDRVER